MISNQRDEIKIELDRLMAIAETRKLEILTRLYLDEFDELLESPSEPSANLAESFREKAIKDHIKELKALSAANRDILIEVVRDTIANVTKTGSGIEGRFEDTFKPMLDRIDQLLNRLEAIDKREQPIRHHLLYVILTVLLAIATGLLVKWGWVDTPDVQINWDVGTIIQGVAVGTAALIAALTYAHRD